MTQVRFNGSYIELPKGMTYDGDEANEGWNPTLTYKGVIIRQDPGTHYGEGKGEGMYLCWAWGKQRAALSLEEAIEIIDHPTQEVSHWLTEDQAKQQAKVIARKVMKRTFVTTSVSDGEHEFHIEIHQEPTNKQKEMDDDNSPGPWPWWLRIEVPNKTIREIAQGDSYQSIDIYDGASNQFLTYEDAWAAAGDYLKFLAAND